MLLRSLGAPWTSARSRPHPRPPDPPHDNDSSFFAPVTSDTVRLLLVVLVSAVAGGMNAIAGGGTLLTFPALIGLGVPPIVANATSTVALWPGSLGSIWGYRDELRGARLWAIGFAVPSLLGGALGAWLLLHTPPGRFDRLVPWLVLGATTLFMVQGPLMARVRRRRGMAAAGEVDHGSDAARTRELPSASILVYQFFVGVYGGYFGAGIGILMLAALGFMGLTNIHRMNGLKNWGGLCMNAVAAATFAFSSLVNWPVALSMAAGALAGGYGGSRLALRVPQRYVRYAIIVVGLAAGIWLMR
jgi:uncharacterized protein